MPRATCACFDRKKDMINRGGYKIYTHRGRERADEPSRRRRGRRHRQALPGARRARPRRRLPQSARARTAEELARHCAAVLADYKVPDTFSFRTDPLPRNANGKVMKRELKDEHK